jgi:hypothetical protein
MSFFSKDFLGLSQNSEYMSTSWTYDNSALPLDASADALEALSATQKKTM